MISSTQKNLSESPSDALFDLVRQYDLKSVWQELSTTMPETYEKIRNRHEAYASRQVQPDGETLERARELVNQLSGPSISIMEVFFPGPQDIADSLKSKNTYKTLREPNNQGKNEPIFQFSEGIYVRAEEYVKSAAHGEFTEQWGRMLSDCLDEINLKGKNVEGKIPQLKERLEAALHRGPSSYEKSEVAEIIRHTTFVDPKTVNPHSHIPFRNGLLSLETFKLEPFDPEKFFIYRVEASYLDTFVSLQEAPLFKGYVQSVYHPLDIPLVLQYLGYSLMPGKPRDKVLFVVGREGVGKGVLDRIMEGLIPDGKGAVDLNKILTADRFQFSGLDRKILLSDPEIDRKFRKGVKITTRNFNTLFGSDSTYNEEKFHEGKKQIYHSKGIFIGNLPLFKLDDMATFRRILLIQTLTDRTSKDVADFHLKILQNERDVIATLFVQYLKVLKSFDWVFLNEPTKESIAEIWAQFADPIAGFEDEYLSEMQGNEINEDKLIAFFKEVYCKPKGITAPPDRTFKARISKSYPRAKRGAKGKRYWNFTNIQCEGMDQDVSHKVDTTKNVSESPEIKVSRDNRYGVQIRYNIPVKGGRGIPPLRELFVPKVDTDKNISEEPENKAPEKNKTVSTSQETPQNGTKRYMILKDYNPDMDPLKRDLPSKEGSIIEVDKEDDWVRALLREGYIAPYKEAQP